MNNITIANNKIEGREGQHGIRVRLFDINVHNGDKQPTDTVIDIPLGSEERVNVGPNTGFEVRALKEGESYASDDGVVPDYFGIVDAYKKLKDAIRAIPMIRADMTLSESERDAKAAAAWQALINLAHQ